MTLRRFLTALVLVGLFYVVLAPPEAHAWTHSTHIYLGETVLSNLRFLPSAIADLLHAFPYDFLYGSIAPDASIAKRYVPEGRHSHFWNVGQEIYDFAEIDSIRAVGLGYLSHLAADTVAHNFFVPRQLMLTSSTRTMGHSYWEVRAETHLTDRYSRKARDLIRLDHRMADVYLEKIISPTLFSVSTNRRLFRGMVHLTHTKSWQRAMQAARERSRWLLTDRDVERHLALAYDLTMEVLSGIGQRLGRAREIDPSGHEPLRQVKRWRRSALLRGGLLEPERMIELANEKFGLPELELGYWAESLIERPWLTGPPALPPPPAPVSDEGWKQVGHLLVPTDAESEPDEPES